MIQRYKDNKNEILSYILFAKKQVRCNPVM